MAETATELGWTAKGPAPTSFCYDSGAAGHGEDLSPHQAADLVTLAFPTPSPRHFRCACRCFSSSPATATRVAHTRGLLRWRVCPLHVGYLLRRAGSVRQAGRHPPRPRQGRTIAMLKDGGSLVAVYDAHGGMDRAIEGSTSRIKVESIFFQDSVWLPGSAIGFRLYSLLKLTDTRATNNKMTLMHYLCKVLASRSPNLLDFHEDHVNLEAASKIQLKPLAEEMQAITKGLEMVELKLTASENDGRRNLGGCRAGERGGGRRWGDSASR
ncbi:hypothetical protein Taro_041300 [Colocasia esculenta]|uniref:FH2 domain-containing protein n=1 Tax=Colocasia esculenta TaxID=4460 RepID=A0A843WL47_COLES|nr:hypothetical protein [Colocasia esculenta]